MFRPPAISGKILAPVKDRLIIGLFCFYRKKQAGGTGAYFFSIPTKGDMLFILTGTGKYTHAPQCPKGYEGKEVLEMRLEKSKRGLPVTFETGGGMTNTGSSQIIASCEGKPKEAIFIFRAGTLACSKHSVIPVEAGDYIISVWRHREECEVKTSRISKILPQDNSFEAETEDTEYRCLLGDEKIVWEEDITPPKFLIPAIEAGIEKALCYHCREPHFTILPNFQN